MIYYSLDIIYTDTRITDSNVCSKARTNIFQNERDILCLVIVDKYYNDVVNITMNTYFVTKL